MRQKTRLRASERASAIKIAEAHLLPDLKRFLNNQPFKVRLRMAWRILKGNF